MRFLEFHTISKKKVLNESARVGREFQHLEDLVFVDGSNGAQQAMDILERLGSDSSDVVIKWDGNPTIYWGREPNGEFVLVGKNGWGKQRSTDPEDLANFIKNSGKGEEWREKFGNDMAALWPLLESSTPTTFKGFVYGDLLYHPGKPFSISKNSVEFTPNLVTYTVNKQSSIGERISKSKIGVVVHSKFDEFGSKNSTPISDVDELNSDNVVVLGQTYTTHQPKIDIGEIKEIRSMIKRNAQSIDDFLAPRKGLSDIKNIIYTYVNQMSRSRQLKNIENGFFDWLKNSKVSTNKQAKIKEMTESNPDALPAIFGLIKRIMSAKDNIINQLDSAETDITATTRGESGGEGYVALRSKIKLVPRTRWQPN